MDTKVMEMDECLNIGEKVCNRIIEHVIQVLNTKHPAVNGMPFVTNLSLELYQKEGLLEDIDPDVDNEIGTLIEAEYNKLDELEQHCVFLYSELPDNDKAEILSTIQWWLEEKIDDLGMSLVSTSQTDNKFLS
jgi:hypothetical protein